MISRPWYHWPALGFGSGLAPRMPGTVGTIAAVPLYLFLVLVVHNHLLYIMVLAAMAAVGPWLCGQTARDMQAGSSDKHVLDPPAIVWDEWVGLLVTMCLVPPGWGGLLAGFLLFRFFDMLKPWPISWLDQHIHGGIGIMLDDIAAAIPALVILRIILWAGWL